LQRPRPRQVRCTNTHTHTRRHLCTHALAVPQASMEHAHPRTRARTCSSPSTLFQARFSKHTFPSARTCVSPSTLFQAHALAVAQAHYSDALHRGELRDRLPGCRHLIARMVQLWVLVQELVQVGNAVQGTRRIWRGDTCV